MTLAPSAANGYRKRLTSEAAFIIARIASEKDK